MQAFTNIHIYYFSGTGNAAHVAQWIARYAKLQGLTSQVENIARMNPEIPIITSPTELLVFVSPVHGFNYPPVMINFLCRFPRGKGQVMLLNTRAGMLLGKWVTPGLSGISLYLAALVLISKGYRLHGMMPVDLPSNWISLHPGLNEATIRYLYERNQTRVEHFTQHILSERKSFYRATREIIQDILISPIAFLYYFIGRFVIARTFFASSACDGCNLCISSCPVKAIVKVDQRPFWTFRCESCMHCINVCPKRAIETSHGFVVVLILIYTFLIPLFYLYFNQYCFQLSQPVLQFLAESTIFLLLTGMLYKGMHYLLRFRIFEKWLVYTSLTHLKGWRRYNPWKILPKE